MTVVELWIAVGCFVVITMIGMIVAAVCVVGAVHATERSSRTRFGGQL